MLEELCKNYNIAAEHLDGTTIIRTPHCIRMCLNWEEPISDYTPYEENEDSELNFDRNDRIASAFAELMRNKGATYLASDIDMENNRHRGIGVDSGYTKPLYVLKEENEKFSILGYIETTCMDCPWKGGMGPDWKTLMREFQERGMKILEPGPVGNPEIEKILPKKEYFWEMITLRDE